MPFKCQISHASSFFTMHFNKLTTAVPTNLDEREPNDLNSICAVKGNAIYCHNKVHMFRNLSDIDGTVICGYILPRNIRSFMNEWMNSRRTSQHVAGSFYILLPVVVAQNHISRYFVSLMARWCFMFLLTHILCFSSWVTCSVGIQICVVGELDGSKDKNRLIWRKERVL